MIRSLRTKFRRLSGGGERTDRASILLPFLIISAGLGVLAWRSYQLSVKMERGANLLAGQYARYAAEITARRLDAAASAELSGASDQWQLIERRADLSYGSSLREWLTANDWIVSAIYMPDSDPASSVFISGQSGKGDGEHLQVREFFTSTGTVKYTYDPTRLVRHVLSAVRQQPLIGSGANEPRPAQPAVVGVAHSPRTTGLTRDSDRFLFVASLQAPLADWAVRASVLTAYGSGNWQSQRTISLLVSLVALLLTGIGALLALRGLTKEAETMKLRSALIANVSHELRTPLAMIRLGAETLKRGSKLSPADRAEIEDQILREVLHLTHLVENVLDVARMQHRNAKALAFTAVSPRELIANLLSSYGSWIRSKGFEIGLQVDDSVEAQMWDRDAVSRALLNLIDNAMKYSDENKSIDIVLGQTAEHVLIEVRDRGIGIAADDLAHIFDPYFRAQFSDTQTRRGAGLGLTLVRQIVESHDGTVEVESTPGRGSTFRLLFPKATAEEQLALAGIIQSKPLPS